MALRVNKQIKENLKAVKELQKVEIHGKELTRNRPLPSAIVAQELPPEAPPTRALKLGTMKVYGSKGKVYEITIPSHYLDNVPKRWEWNEQRYRVAELIAAGTPIAQVARAEGMPSRMTIYAWLQHPEFKEFVDAIVMETGWANRRERIAMLSKVNDMVFSKISENIHKLKLTDKNVGALLQIMPTIARHVAQEKEEFVETTKVDSNITASVTTVRVEDVIRDCSEDERAKLEAEFELIADRVVAGITSYAEEKSAAIDIEKEITEGDKQA